MCHLLYCLNWHIRDLNTAIASTPAAKEREAFARKAEELRTLKAEVLAKLVAEKKASLHGIQRCSHTKKKYYSIRLNRSYSFHLPVERYKEILNEQETIFDVQGDKARAGDL